VAAAFVWSRACGHDDGKRHPHPTLRGLDVNAFRSALAARLRRATELAARPNSAPATSRAARTDKWPMLGKGAVPNAGTDLIEPQCTIGPRELCTLLDGLVRGCDAGGARDCLAVGQYLADTPPRGAITVTFFMQACRIGNPAGCERVDELKSASKLDCERDPLACSYTAMHTQNRELHDLACSFGAADSCSVMSWFTNGDVELSRAYLEQACQLGCRWLAPSLATASDQDVWRAISGAAMRRIRARQAPRSRLGAPPAGQLTRTAPGSIAITSDGSCAG